jgi:tetratricopeptide (TPR) repeat protein
MQDHLDRDALERLVHRRCHASRAYGWLLHLLACTECRERVVRDYPDKGDRFLREIFRTQEPLRPPDLSDQDRLDRVLEDLQTHGLVEYLQEGDIPPLLADLHRHPPDRQRLILDNTERLWNLSTVDYLLDRSEGEVFRDPPYGERLAEMALSVLDRLSLSHYHPRLLNDLRGQAWGLRGNFMRIRERLGAAKQDLERSAAALDSGTGAINERILLLHRFGALEESKYNYNLSIEFHERALELGRASGVREAEIRGVAWLVRTLPDAGRPVEAIQLGEKYLDQTSVERDELDVILSLQQNMTIALCDLGRGLPAYQLHQKMLGNLPRDQPRVTTKVRWQRLAVFESLGDFQAADEVAQGLFDEINSDWEPTNPGLLLTDRSRLALRRGDRNLARKYGREACQIFEARGWPNLSKATQRMLAGGPLVRLS